MTYALYTGKSTKWLKNGNIYKVISTIHNSGNNKSIGDELILDSIPHPQSKKYFQLFEGYVAFSYVLPKVGERLYLSRVVKDNYRELVLERVLTTEVSAIAQQGNKYMVITCNGTVYELTVIG